MVASKFHPVSETQIMYDDMFRYNNNKAYNHTTCLLKVTSMEIEQSQSTPDLCQ